MNELDDLFNVDIEDFDLDVSFSDNELDDEESRVFKPIKQRHKKPHQIKFRYADEMTDKIKIDKGSRYFAIVDGTFIFGDFIEAFLVKNNCHAESLTITTLSLSVMNIQSLEMLIDKGYIGNLHIVVSDYFYSHERNVIIKEMYRRLDKDNKFQLSVCRTHMKTALIKTLGGKFITIHGSANLRSSDNIEQFAIEEDEDLYNFNMEFIDKIKEKYKTINKTVRGSHLF